jgi:hypothetical protein
MTIKLLLGTAPNPDIWPIFSWLGFGRFANVEQFDPRLFPIRVGGLSVRAELLSNRFPFGSAYACPWWPPNPMS